MEKEKQFLWFIEDDGECEESGKVSQSWIFYFILSSDDGAAKNEIIHQLKREKCIKPAFFTFSLSLQLKLKKKKQ